MTNQEYYARKAQEAAQAAKKKQQEAAAAAKQAASAAAKAQDAAKAQQAIKAQQQAQQAAQQAQQAAKQNTVSQSSTSSSNTSNSSSQSVSDPWYVQSGYATAQQYYNAQQQNKAQTNLQNTIVSSNTTDFSYLKPTTAESSFTPLAQQVAANNTAYAQNKTTELDSLYDGTASAYTVQRYTRLLNAARESLLTVKDKDRENLLQNISTYSKALSEYEKKSNSAELAAQRALTKGVDEQLYSAHDSREKYTVLPCTADVYKHGNLAEVTVMNDGRFLTKSAEGYYSIGVDKLDGIISQDTTVFVDTTTGQYYYLNSRNSAEKLAEYDKIVSDNYQASAREANKLDAEYSWYNSVVQKYKATTAQADVYWQLYQQSGNDEYLKLLNDCATLCNSYANTINGYAETLDKHVQDYMDAELVRENLRSNADAKLWTLEDEDEYDELKFKVEHGQASSAEINQYATKSAERHMYGGQALVVSEDYARQAVTRQEYMRDYLQEQENTTYNIHTESEGTDSRHKFYNALVTMLTYEQANSLKGTIMQEAGLVSYTDEERAQITADFERDVVQGLVLAPYDTVQLIQEANASIDKDYELYKAGGISAEDYKTKIASTRSQYSAYVLNNVLQDMSVVTDLFSVKELATAAKAAHGKTDAETEYELEIRRRSLYGDEYVTENKKTWQYIKAALMQNFMKGDAHYINLGTDTWRHADGSELTTLETMAAEMITDLDFLFSTAGMITDAAKLSKYAAEYSETYLDMCRKLLKEQGVELTAEEEELFSKQFRNALRKGMEDSAQLEEVFQKAYQNSAETALKHIDIAEETASQYLKECSELVSKYAADDALAAGLDMTKLVQQSAFSNVDYAMDEISKIIGAGTNIVSFGATKLLQKGITAVVTGIPKAAFSIVRMFKHAQDLVPADALSDALVSKVGMMRHELATDVLSGAFTPDEVAQLAKFDRTLSDRVILSVYSPTVLDLTEQLRKGLTDVEKYCNDTFGMSFDDVYTKLLNNYTNLAELSPSTKTLVESLTAEKKIAEYSALHGGLLEHIDSAEALAKELNMDAAMLNTVGFNSRVDCLDSAAIAINKFRSTADLSALPELFDSTCTTVLDSIGRELDGKPTPVVKYLTTLAELTEEYARYQRSALINNALHTDYSALVKKYAQVEDVDTLTPLANILAERMKTDGINIDADDLVSTVIRKLDSDDTISTADITKLRKIMPTKGVSVYNLCTDESVLAVVDDLLSWDSALGMQLRASNEGYEVLQNAIAIKSTSEYITKLHNSGVSEFDTMQILDAMTGSIYKLNDGLNNPAKSADDLSDYILERMEYNYRMDNDCYPLYKELQCDTDDTLQNVINIEQQWGDRGDAVFFSVKTGDSYMPTEITLRKNGTTVVFRNSDYSTISGMAHDLEQYLAENVEDGTALVGFNSNREMCSAASYMYDALGRLQVKPHAEVVDLADILRAENGVPFVTSNTKRAIRDNMQSLCSSAKLYSTLQGVEANIAFDPKHTFVDDILRRPSAFPADAVNAAKTLQNNFGITAFEDVGNMLGLYIDTEALTKLYADAGKHNYINITSILADVTNTATTRTAIDAEILRHWTGDITADVITLDELTTLCKELDDRISAVYRVDIIDSVDWKRMLNNAELTKNVELRYGLVLNNLDNLNNRECYALVQDILDNDPIMFKRLHDTKNAVYAIPEIAQGFIAGKSAKTLYDELPTDLYKLPDNDYIEFYRARYNLQKSAELFEFESKLNANDIVRCAALNDIYDSTLAKARTLDFTHEQEKHLASQLEKYYNRPVSLTGNEFFDYNVMHGNVKHMEESLREAVVNRNSAESAKLFSLDIADFKNHVKSNCNNRLVIQPSAESVDKTTLGSLVQKLMQDDTAVIETKQVAGIDVICIHYTDVDVQPTRVDYRGMFSNHNTHNSEITRALDELFSAEDYIADARTGITGVKHNYSVLGDTALQKYFDPYYSDNYINQLTLEFNERMQYNSYVDDIIGVATSRYNTVEFLKGSNQNFIHDAEKQGMHFVEFKQYGNRYAMVKSHSDSAVMLTPIQYDALQKICDDTRINVGCSTGLTAGNAIAGLYKLYQDTALSLQKSAMLFGSVGTWIHNYQTSAVNAFFEGAKDGVDGISKTLNHYTNALNYQKFYAECLSVIDDLTPEGIDTWLKSSALTPAEQDLFLKLHAANTALTGGIDLVDTDWVAKSINTLQKYTDSAEDVYDIFNSIKPRYVGNDIEAWEKAAAELRSIGVNPSAELQEQFYKFKPARETWGNFIKEHNPLWQFNAQKFSNAETRARLAVYMSALDNGSTTDEALQRVVSTQFQYGGAGVQGVVLPFMTYTFANLGYFMDYASLSRQKLSYRFMKSADVGFENATTIAESLQKAAARDYYFGKDSDYVSPAEQNYRDWLASNNELIYTLIADGVDSFAGLPKSFSDCSIELGSNHYIKFGNSLIDEVDLITTVGQSIATIGAIKSKADWEVWLQNTYLHSRLYSPLKAAVDFGMSGQSFAEWAFNNSSEAISGVPVIGAILSQVSRNIKSLKVNYPELMVALADAKTLAEMRDVLCMVAGIFIPSYVGTASAEDWTEAVVAERTAPVWLLQNDHPESYISIYADLMNLGYTYEDVQNYMSIYSDMIDEGEYIAYADFAEVAADFAVKYGLEEAYDILQQYKFPAAGKQTVENWYLYAYSALGDLYKYDKSARDRLVQYYKSMGLSTKQAWLMLYADQQAWVSADGTLQHLSDAQVAGKIAARRAAYYSAEDMSDAAWEAYWADMPDYLHYTKGAWKETMAYLQNVMGYSYVEAMQKCKEGLCLVDGELVDASKLILQKNRASGYTQWTQEQAYAYCAEIQDRLFEEWGYTSFEQFWAALPEYTKYTKGVYSNTLNVLKQLGYSYEERLRLVHAGIAAVPVSNEQLAALALAQYEQVQKLIAASTEVKTTYNLTDEQWAIAKQLAAGAHDAVVARRSAPSYEEYMAQFAVSKTVMNAALSMIQSAINKAGGNQFTVNGQAYVLADVTGVHTSRSYSRSSYTRRSYTRKSWTKYTRRYNNWQKRSRADWQKINLQNGKRPKKGARRNRAWHIYLNSPLTDKRYVSTYSLQNVLSGASYGARQMYKTNLTQFRNLKPASLKSAVPSSYRNIVYAYRRSMYDDLYAKYGTSRMVMRTNGTKNYTNPSTTKLRREHWDKKRKYANVRQQNKYGKDKSSRIRVQSK